MPAAGRIGDISQCPADAHGCPACPHPAMGPAIVGSPTVLVNSLPALRLGDQGVHAACCGPNTWTAQEGSASVLLNGKPAHRVGDMDQHCGGVGKLMLGSPTVAIGGPSGGAGEGKAPSSSQDKSHWVEVQIVDASGRGLAGRPFALKLPDGSEKRGRVPKDGRVRVEGIVAGACSLTVADIDDARWSKHRAGHEEEVEMRVTALGYDAGTAVKLEVFRVHEERKAVATESATLDAAGHGAARFRHALGEKEGDAAAFLFKATIDDVTCVSSVLIVERAIPSARFVPRLVNEGDEVELVARTRGIPPGTTATITLHHAGHRAGDDPAIATLSATVEGDHVRATWKAERSAEDPDVSHAYFVVRAAGARAASEMLRVRPAPEKAPSDDGRAQQASERGPIAGGTSSHDLGGRPAGEG